MADGVGEAEAFLLLDIADADAVVGAVAEGVGDVVAEVADDDDDVLNAEGLHVLELVGEEGLVADGGDRLGELLAEGPHAGAVSGGQNDALVLWGVHGR